MIKQLALVVFFALLLSACSEEENKTIENPVAQYVAKAPVLGEYVGTDRPNQTLTLSGKALLNTGVGVLTKTYSVRNSHIYLHLSAAEGEKRPDLALAIVDDGKRLVCSACAKYGWASLWKRVG